MPEHSSIGTRFKNNYESRARYYLLRRTPVIIRVDGRAFHTLTRNMEKPFDPSLIDNMVQAALGVADQIQGFKLGYVQSDEASFLVTDYDSLETQAWFDYNKSKIETIAASAMSVFFSQLMGVSAMFDARAFNVPVNEVSNYFLWRALDWHRNSVSMYAQSFFSQKDLHKKRVADMHEMLHGIGMNWTTDLDPIERNGTFIFRCKGSLAVTSTVVPNYASIDTLVREAGIYNE